MPEQLIISRHGTPRGPGADPAAGSAWGPQDLGSANHRGGDSAEADRPVARELTLAEGQRDRLVFDTACPGLGVRLTRAGTRTFIAQWMDPATKRKVREPLGVWGALTVDQAREAARVRLGAVAKGVNPRAERAKARAEAERERAETALTFDALVTEWAALHLVKRRPRYAAEAVRAIRFAFADLMKRPAARITKSEVLRVLDRLVRDGKAVTAGRTMSYARSAFSWAEKRGKVPGNPFKGLPIAPFGEARDRALTDAELAEVWAAAGAMAYPFGLLFRLAILTLQRREELAGMRWSEISGDGTKWTIPGARMKNGSIRTSCICPAPAATCWPECPGPTGKT